MPESVDFYALIFLGQYEIILLTAIRQRDTFCALIQIFRNVEDINTFKFR